MDGSDRVRFFEHDGMKILSIDYTHENREQILETLAYAGKLIRNEPENSVRILADLRETQVPMLDSTGVYDRAFVDAVKSYLTHNLPFVRASASLVSQDETSHVFMTFLERVTGRQLVTFEDRDEAIGYLKRE